MLDADLLCMGLTGINPKLIYDYGGSARLEREIQVMTRPCMPPTAVCRQRGGHCGSPATRTKSAEDDSPRMRVGIGAGVMLPRDLDKAVPA